MEPGYGNWEFSPAARAMPVWSSAARGAQGSFDCRREAPGGRRMRVSRLPLRMKTRSEILCLAPSGSRLVIRDVGAILSHLTTRTSAALCAPPGPLDPSAGPHRENWPEVGVPRRPRASHVVAYCRVREKNKWQRTPFAAGEFGRKCERGDSPLSQKGNDASELAAARSRIRPWNPATGKFRVSRREAPGGLSVRGPNAIQNYTNADRTPPYGPARRPLDLQCSIAYTIRPVSDAYNQTGTVTRAQRR